MISSLISSVRKRNHPVVQAPVGGGPTHYVSNSGSATWAQAVNSGTPCSAATAMANAVAGNIVQFATGRYTLVGSDARFTPALSPANSGSSGNPIVFQTDGGVVDFEFSSGTGPVFGVAGKNYITWNGFTVDQALCPGAAGDESCAVLHDANNCIIEYCDLDGNAGVNIGADALHSAIRLDGQTDGRNSSHTIRYNYLHDVSGTSAQAGNCAGILILDTQGINYIEHNEFDTCNYGFMIKRSNGQNAAAGRTPPTGKWHIRYNYLHGGYGGLRIDQFVSSDVAYSADVYQNLVIANDGVGFLAWNYATTYISRNIRVVNNTFVNGAYVGVLFAIDPTSTDVSHVFQNNVLIDCGSNLANTGTLANYTQANVDAEHNVYHGGTTHFTEGWENVNTAKTFAQWQTQGQDIEDPDGFETADPVFINEAGGNYRPDTGSPLLDAGIDVLNLQGLGTSEPINCGCYVTGLEVIGRE